MKQKYLVVGMQLALGLGAVGTANAATNLTDVNLSSGNFTYSGGLNLSNSQLTFNPPLNGNYGEMNVTGDYSGNKSSIYLNTFLDAGGTTSANQGSNRIRINGNASGQTTLVIKNNGGPGASTDSNGNTFNDAPEGISIAQVSGSSSANAFTLQGGYVAVGPYQYQLAAYAPGQADASQRLVAADADGHWDYRLQNAKAATGGVTPPVAPPTPGKPSAGTGRPGLIPQAPSYLTHANALFAYGQQTISTLHQRLGETGGAHHPGKGNAEFFVRAFGGDHRYASNLVAGDYGYDYDQNTQGLQLGGNWLKLDGEASSLRLGLALSAGTTHVSPESIYGAVPNSPLVPIEVSREKTRATSLAATATWQHASGVYVDGLVGGSQYESDITTPFRSGKVAKLESNDVFASIEAGYAWALTDRVTIEPQAQVSWQKLDTERTTDIDGVVVDLGTPEMLVWRVGARALFTPAVGSVLTQYVKLNYYDSEGPEQRAILSGSRFVTGQFGHTAELGYGLTAHLKPNLSLYGDVALQSDIGHASREGWAATAGAKWVF